MRISDWSSDVCSSDLLFHFTLKLPLPLQQLLQLVDDLGLAATEQSRNLGQTLLFVGNVGQCRRAGDRKSVVEGKSVSVRVDLGGRRSIKKKKKTTKVQRYDVYTEQKNKHSSRS